MEPSSSKQPEYKQDPESARAIVYGYLFQEPAEIEEDPPYVVLEGHRVLTPGIGVRVPDDLPDDEVIASALQQAHVPDDVTDVVREAFSSVRNAPAPERASRLKDALVKSDLPIEQSEHGDIFLKTDEGSGIVLYHQDRRVTSTDEPADETTRILTSEFKRSLEDAVQSGQCVVIDEGRIKFYRAEEFLKRLRAARKIAHGSERLQIKGRKIASLIGMSESSAATLIDQL